LIRLAVNRQRHPGSGAHPGHPSRVRIIGGVWRRRWLPVAAVSGLRPSADAQRETLFNWLQHEIPGTRALDAFAGSGALGFEAASRGARAVVMLERNRVALRQLHASTEALGAEAVHVLGVDALRWLAQSPASVGQEPFDLVFIDPPFYQGTVARTLTLLSTGQWLKPCAHVYVEQERDLAPPIGWSIVRETVCGEARGLLLECG